MTNSELQTLTSTKKCQVTECALNSGDTNIIQGEFEEAVTN